MKRPFKTDALKRLGRKAKSKRGTTLIEMVATVAILSIVALLSLQAVFIANEEYRRVHNISEAQRSISLMQENLNKYLKTATDIRLIPDTSGASTVEQAINDYTYTRNTNPDTSQALQDAENDSTDNYNDYIMYRSGTFSYTLSKYTESATGNKFVPIFTVENIKQVNFSLRGLTATNHATANGSYILDYTMISPTNKEMINNAADSASINEGEYSIISGTILNNITSASGITALTIDESATSNKNLIYFRTTQKIVV
ncbi:MAG: type II secretion system protein [Acutalibacteraceae bacterium]|nr:type II secretion system protein [Acutalibacteraceae bacterium]